MERKSIKTTKAQIVEYWSSRVSESDIAVDWADAEEYCWVCGGSKNIQRCHIIPAARGGSDEPANLVLLCKDCHKEGINSINPDDMWRWIKAYHSDIAHAPFHQRICAKYESLYHTNWENDLDVMIAKLLEKGMLEAANAEIRNIIKELQIEASVVHFGEKGFNIASKAAIRRMFIKKIYEEFLQESI